MSRLAARPRHWPKWSLILGAVSMLVVIACGDSGTSSDGETSTTASADWEPEYVDGVLQPLPDGFPDKAITIVVADEAASAEGIQVTHLQEAATGISPVPIELEARTDFQGIPTWEAIAYINENDDGMAGYQLVNFATVGSLADIGAIDVKDTTGVDMADVQPVVTTEDTRWFVGQCAEVGWEPTMEALVAETQANPGQVRFAGSGGVGGSDLGFFSYLKALEAGEIDIIPVGGGTEKATATAACETDVTIATIETTLPHVQSGAMDYVMVNGSDRVADFPDLPTAADLGIEGGGLVSSKQLVAADDVPELHVLWLDELFRTILQNEDYVANRASLPGIEVTYAGPEDSAASNEAALATVEEVLTDLGLHISQQ